MGEIEGQAIGALPAGEALQRLQAAGDPDYEQIASALSGADTANLSLDQALEIHWPGHNGSPPAWKNSQPAYGYIPPAAAGTASAAIIDARQVAADESLMGSRIDVRLSQLHVESYPGGNQTHRVLFTFEGKNQVPHDEEQLAFNMTANAREGEDAPIANWPIFVGLNVSSEGVGFHFSTTNVSNAEDHKILDFLNSPTFTSGLKLAETAQPAIKPLTDIAVGLGKTFLTRSDNVLVQEVYLGLDFASNAAGVRLAQGDYIVAQVPKGVVVNWNLYKFENGAVRAPDGYDTQFPYNYIVFSVGRYTGGDT